VSPWFPGWWKGIVVSKGGVWGLTGTFAGVENVIVSTTGYTGSGGFEIYFDNANAPQIWDAIFEAGADCGIKPIGLAARDTLRLEMGFCLYGNDIDDTTSPLEAGLGWVTKFTKEFTNSAALLKQKEDGITNRLVAFELLDRGIPRHGYSIVDEAGNEIGKVTSGTMGPSVKKAIGLGCKILTIPDHLPELSAGYGARLQDYPS